MISNSKLKKWRTKNKLRLSDIAEACEVNKSTVSRWERFGVPVERAVVLEKRLGVSRIDLRPDFFARSK